MADKRIAPCHRDARKRPLVLSDRTIYQPGGKIRLLGVVQLALRANSENAARSR